MLREIRPAIVMILAMTVLTGLVYPLAMTGIAQFVFPHQANGSLIEKDGKVIGSALLGQNFDKPEYFHGRPSATTDTDPKDSSKTVPVPRVAKARGLDEAKLRQLVQANTEIRTFGVLGEPRVNVLQLNIALDALKSR